jgi:hypothetical protein
MKPLDGKTPAEEAHVDYTVKNWADLARVPVSKEAEKQSHTTPKTQTVTEKVNLDKAFKRKRGPQPRGSTHLSVGELKARRHGLSQPMPPTTPKLGHIHHTKNGTGLTRRMDR